MRFTWLTYRVAMRRQFRREYNAFVDHHQAFRGPDLWFRELTFGRRLRDRHQRERGRRGVL